MASAIDFLVPGSLGNPDELTTVLESLPSYESLTQTSDEPPVFDDEKEPATGIIDIIRHNSQSEESTITHVG
jgi:hypothetical protein